MNRTTTVVVALIAAAGLSTMAYTIPEQRVYTPPRYGIPQMIHKGAGAIVNMSSGADVTGIPQNPIYDTSKHVVLELTKSAALGYTKSGIRINAVTPGLVKTDIIASDDTAADSKEIANAVVWLLASTKDTWYLMEE